MNYSDCEYFKSIGGADENIGLCEDEGGHMAPCLLWLNESAVCPTLLELLLEQGVVAQWEGGLP